MNGSGNHTGEAIDQLRTDRGSVIRAETVEIH
jgi:hypothetical protein